MAKPYSVGRVIVESEIQIWLSYLNFRLDLNFR